MIKTFVIVFCAAFAMASIAVADNGDLAEFYEVGKKGKGKYKHHSPKHYRGHRSRGHHYYNRGYPRHYRPRYYYDDYRYYGGNSFELRGGPTFSFGW